MIKSKQLKLITTANQNTRIITRYAKHGNINHYKELLIIIYPFYEMTEYKVNHVKGIGREMIEYITDPHKTINEAIKHYNSIDLITT